MVKKRVRIPRSFLVMFVIRESLYAHPVYRLEFFCCYLFVLIWSTRFLNSNFV